MSSCWTLYRMSRLSSLFFPYLTVAVFVCAFASALLPSPPYEAHCVLLTVALLGFGLAFLVLKHPYGASIPPLHWMVYAPLGLFWALALLSVFLSQAPFTSYIYFWFVSALPLTFFWTRAVPEAGREAFFRRCAVFMAVIVAALAAWSVYQYFFVTKYLAYAHVRWPFADSNALGAFLSLSFFSSVGLMLVGKTRTLSNTGLALALLILAAMLTTGSRGTLLFMSIGMVFFVLGGWAHFRRHWRCVAMLAGGLAVAFALLTFLAPDSVRPPNETVFATLAGKIPVVWSRPEIWKSALALARDHFWTGTGVGTFYIYYPGYRGGDLTSAGRMVHNDPLQYWVEMGIFSPLLFYGLIAMAVFLTVRALKRLPPGDDRRIHILAPFCALGAIAGNAHITFPFYVFASLTMAGFLLGYWFWNIQKVLAGDFARLPALKLPEIHGLKAGLMGLLVAGVYGFLMLQVSEITITRAQERMGTGDLHGFVRDVNRAGRMAHGVNVNALILASSIPYGILENQRGLTPEKKKELFLQAYNLIKQSEKVNPLLPANLYNLARLMERLPAEAKGEETPEKLLQKGLALDPLHYPTRIMLTNIYLKNDEKKAYETLKGGLKWKEAANYPDGYYQMLAALAGRAGDTEVQKEALLVLGFRRQAQKNRL